MTVKIAFLTEDIGDDTYKEIIYRLNSFHDFETKTIWIDIATEKGQEKAEEILSQGNVDLALVHIKFGLGLHGLVSRSQVPLVFLPFDPNLLMIPADLVAFARSTGVNASMHVSLDNAIERIKAILTPPVLAGKRILVFGEPFRSTTIPSFNLTAEYVLKQTGVEVIYRPLEQLGAMFDQVDDEKTKSEFEKWMQNAIKIVEPSSHDVEAASRLYVLLRDLVDRENLSGISIDCVRYSFSRKPILPHPCLAFSRLRDEGISAPCEGDLYAMLSSLLVEQICRKPSFMGNVAAVDLTASTVTLLHCTTPLQLIGYDSDPMPYSLRDYHGRGVGVVPEIDFQLGQEVTLGSFSKDLRNFALWSGNIIETGDIFCRNSAKIQINDADRFLNSIVGCHYVMVYGNYLRAISDILLKMNISVIGPMTY